MRAWESSAQLVLSRRLLPWESMHPPPQEALLWSSILQEGPQKRRGSPTPRRHILEARLAENHGATLFALRARPLECSQKAALAATNPVRKGTRLNLPFLSLILGKQSVLTGDLQ